MVGELRLRLRLLDLLVTTGDLAVNGGHVATPLGVARLGSLGAPRCLTLGARSSLDLASHELLQGRGKVRVRGCEAWGLHLACHRPLWDGLWDVLWDGQAARGRSGQRRRCLLLATIEYVACIAKSSDCATMSDPCQIHVRRKGRTLPGRCAKA
eukprot:3313169-Prymnesium_polylepis.1